MLGNNEEIRGVDLAQVFSRMVGELPWASLRAYVQANAQILKRCTLGGHRLEPKQRKRVESLVLKEAEKAEFAQAFANAVFAVWYPVHEELHKTLEEHFHSDDYKKYREENELEEEDYVLTDEKFDAFFELEHLEEWRILLCFSPLKFTAEQAAKILDTSRGNAELLARVKDLEEEAEKLRKQAERAEADGERASTKQQESFSEAQELKKANRLLRAENESLGKSLDQARNESKKFRDAAEEGERSREKLKRSMEEELERRSARLKNDLDRVSKELSDWQGMYEDQRVQNRELEEAIEVARRERDEERTNAAEAMAKAEHLNAFADLILARIDWPKVGAQMKLTPTLRRQFNSLIKKLNYEDDKSLTINDSLPEFWQGLLNLETELVRNITQSDTEEVASGDVEAYWRAMTDAFGDVRISLEARLILLDMLQEIFYQVLDIEDLEDSFIPAKKRTVKASGR